MPDLQHRSMFRRTPNARSNLERPLNLRYVLLSWFPQLRLPNVRRQGMETMTTVLAQTHLASTLVLIGIIWTVQLVHYPLMALVGEEHFIAYEAAHAPRMAAVVMLPWTLQGISTLGLLLVRPSGVPLVLLLAAAVISAIPVLVTVLASVPAHARLCAGFDARVHHRLVRSNWLRTLAWTAQAPIAVAILVRAG
jgi:hypothetical protein